MKYILIVLVLLGYCSMMFGGNPTFAISNQADTIPPSVILHGKVIDEQGKPLIGATILVKGRAVGTVTDGDGNFSGLKLTYNEYIIVNYTGYNPQEILIPVDTQTLLVTLKQDLNVETCGVHYIQLNDPAPLFTKQLPVLHFTHPYQLLRGRVPGLVVSQSGNDPWAVPAMRQRGVPSLTQNASPLWVVDGMPGIAPTMLDVQSMESITLLRRPVDLVTYGLQAGAGVLEVYTTRTVKKKFAVNYQGQLTYERAARLPQVATAEEYRRRPGGIADLGYETDWLEEITQTAVSQGHQLAVSGRDGSTQWQVEGSLRDVQGVGRKSEWTQYTGRVQLQQSLWRERLVLKAQAAGQQRRGQRDYQQAFFYAAKFNPTAPVRFDAPPTNPLLDDLYDFSNLRLRNYFELVGSTDFFNPVAIQEASALYEQRASNLLQAEAILQVADPLRFKFAIGRHVNESLSGEENRTYAFWRSIATLGQPGQAARQNQQNRRSWLRSTLHWEQEISGGLLELTGSYAYQNLEYENESVSGFSFGTDDFRYHNFESFLTDMSFFQQSLYSENTRLIDFGLNSKLRWRWLNWELAVKYQGATNLGEEERWHPLGGTHLTLGLNEIFNINTSSSYELHGGYALVGQLPNDLSYTRGQYDPASRAYVNANPQLRPERRRIINGGFLWQDYGFLGSVNYYASVTKDPILKLIRADLPVELNEQGTNLSQAALRNRSWELSIGWRTKGVVTWRSNLFWSQMKTRLLNTGEAGPEGYFDIYGQHVTAASGPGGFVWRKGIGLVELDAPFGQIVGNQFDRSTTLATGNFTVAEEFQGIALAAPEQDLGVIGNGLPTNTYGWENTFEYGSWRLSLLIRGELGHDLAHLRRGELESFIDQEQFFPQSRNYLSTENDLPDNVNGLVIFSDRYVESGNYLSLDYLSLERTLYLRSSQTLKLSLTGQNLLLWTPYSGVDPSPRYVDEGPEIDGATPTLPTRDGQLAPGIDRRYFYPRSRTLTFGVKWVL